MKIGIQILAYNCVENFSKVIDPWVKLKDEFNFDFWVGSGQFKIYKDMGYKDLNQQTIDLFQIEYKDIIDYLFIPDSNNLFSDHGMRTQSLRYFEEKDIDLIWILDADEFYTENEIRRTINFVLNNKKYDYYNIRLKNFIGDCKEWSYFIPPRIFWSKRYGGIKEHYFDNHFSYKDNSEYRSHQGVTIPREIVFPIHLSWTNSDNTTGPSHIKEKIEYQKKYYNDGCGYKWDKENNKIILSNGNPEEIYLEPDFKKYVILAPICSGKTITLDKYDYWYRGMRLFCGEYESSYRNYINNIKMGGASVVLPESHPLYLSWDDMYKIGVKWFYDMDWNFSSVLIYNMSSHISYLKKNFSDIEIKIVLQDEFLHRENFMKKCETNEKLNKKLIDLIKEESEILHYIERTYNWQYVLFERQEYDRLANIYKVPIYDSVENALQSIFKE